MRSHRVLFVEDDHLSNLENCEFLRSSGYNVTGAYCAPAALEMINRRELLTALVTDIDLGLGANGFDVARAARRVYPHLPVIFISGAAGSRHLAEGVVQSVFISKPFHPQQIVTALDAMFHLAAA